MMKKYKISELAKDLKLASKELVESLKKYFKKPPKTTTSLTDEEANIALELYSQKNQVDSFEEYFKSADLKYSENGNMAEKLHNANDAQNVEKGENLKPTAIEKSSDKLEKKVDNIAQKEKTFENVEEKEHVEKAENKKAKFEKAPPKKENVKNLTAKNVKDVKEKKEKPITITLKKSEKPNASSEVLHEEENKKFVSTKTSQVNFDKYNERYENIANDNKIKDSFQNKKKFKKKVVQKNLKKKETEAQKLQRLALEKARQQKLKISIPDSIVVSELALRLKVNVAQVIKQLMALGVMANANENIDFDTASIVASELGANVEHEVTVTIEERLFEEQETKDEVLLPRDPVVVVVGHVDHGKTSLLDKIRNTNIISSEAGGITQHIGAYTVKIGNKGITFLDTPGHEAFTAMRMRGVNVTDIAVLVVAADDGIMPQTKEAINHAKAAKVSIIVAINKIDKPQANVEKIKNELTEYGLVPEEWGGDVICVPVSAKTGEGISQLLEMIDLVAEVKELKACKDSFAKGSVVEAYLDKGRGPVATLLVQSGTLKVGDYVIAGMALGRVRVMLNDKGKRVHSAGPSTPVEITGLSQVPFAGDAFNAVSDEKLARELVEKRKEIEKTKQFEENKVSLDNIFSQIKQGQRHTINIIVKADTQGSVEAIKGSLEKLSNDEVKISIIHGAVGAISESDVNLALASKAVVVGFNVRPNSIVKNLAQADGVEIRLYRVIYDAIEDLEKAINGILAPKERVVELGSAEVLQVYKISNVGTVAGCYVNSGKVLRKANVRLVRDGIVVAQDNIKSLKRFKDDVKEVLKEFECGIGLEKFNDIKVGDVLEFFIIEQIKDKV